MMMKNTFEKINTLVIGSGAAAYNCADWLYDLGVKDIAILTENRLIGTSRNTGSDKQTYYKMSLAGSDNDSVYAMARTLYDCGGADGDVCVVEAANSLKCFFKLCRVGVPFPFNRFGEYVGYKTDHDPVQRATSVGPLTSKKMTECLEQEVIKKQIKILDKCYVAKIISKDGKVVGLLAVDTSNKEPILRKFICENIVIAVGGPAGIYYESVYPLGHTGSSSLAISCGAKMSNLCEWQYGLASTKFRWNVSGTYQQVLPRYISIDETGKEREFLLDYMSETEALKLVFLKGYQWPFDSRKIKASSLIDLIVMREIHDLGRRVYMDFTREPTGIDEFNNLSEEAYNYLKNSNALISLPIERLKKMNPGAIELYKNHGIDLYSEPLEVAVCAQHLNGGVAVNTDYESSIKNLFACGEVAGSFGIYRPGGSALNSGQVASMRAALAISERYTPNWYKEGENESKIEEEAKELEKELSRIVSEKSTVMEKRKSWQKRMSECASGLRRITQIKTVYNEFLLELQRFEENNRISKPQDVIHYLKNKDILITSLAVLNSMIFEYENAGSRGGAVFIENEPKMVNGQYEINVKEENIEFRNYVFETVKQGDSFKTEKRKCNALPSDSGWFETVWNEFNNKYKKGGNEQCKKT